MIRVSSIAIRLDPLNTVEWPEDPLISHSLGPRTHHTNFYQNHWGVHQNNMCLYTNNVTSSPPVVRTCARSKPFVYINNLGVYKPKFTRKLNLGVHSFVSILSWIGAFVTFFYQSTIASYKTESVNINTCIPLMTQLISSTVGTPKSMPSLTVREHHTMTEPSKYSYLGRVDSPEKDYI